MTPRCEPSASATLLDFVQHKLVKLGTLRFHGNQPPQPHADDVIAWAIVLYEQSSSLHQEVFNDPATTPNELRASRQSLTSQLSSLILLAMAVPEQS
jgi:hypothetical protein